MKKLLLLCVVVLIFALILQSCKKEDMKEEISSQNPETKTIKTPEIVHADDVPPVTYLGSIQAKGLDQTHKQGRSTIYACYYSKDKINKINEAVENEEEINTKLLIPSAAFVTRNEIIIYNDDGSVAKSIPFFFNHTDYSDDYIAYSEVDKQKDTIDRTLILEKVYGDIIWKKQTTFEGGNDWLAYYFERAWILPDAETVITTEMRGDGYPRKLVFHGKNGIELKEYLFYDVSLGNLINGENFICTAVKYYNPQTNEFLNDIDSLNKSNASQGRNFLMYFDKYGEIIWERMINDRNDRYGIDTINKRIIIWEHNINKLTLIDQKTGEDIWQSKFDNSYGSIYFVEEGKTIAIVSSVEKIFIALQAENGQIKYQLKINDYFSFEENVRYPRFIGKNKENKIVVQVAVNNEKEVLIFDLDSGKAVRLNIFNLVDDLENVEETYIHYSLRTIEGTDIFYAWDLKGNIHFYKLN